MRLVLERRAERSILMALVSPLLAIALTLATGALPVLAARQAAGRGAENLFPRSADRPVGVAGDRREGDAAGADRGRAFALLSGECLEHRRRRPVPDRRDLRRLARGQDARHRCGLLGAARDAGARRARRRALCADPGAVQGALRRERNPDQPDAGLCRRTAARLSGARAVARSERLQLPDHGGIRRRRRDADPDRGQPAAFRRDHRAAGGDLGGRHARPHAERLRDQAGRRRAARRALRGLQRQDADRRDLR